LPKIASGWSTTKAAAALQKAVLQLYIGCFSAAVQRDAANIKNGFDAFDTKIRSPEADKSTPFACPWTTVRDHMTPIHLVALIELFEGALKACSVCQPPRHTDLLGNLVIAGVWRAKTQSP
jgi:hypothetical protein